MKNKVKILHSFPSNEFKFKEYCELTFNSERYNNIYVDSFEEINFSKVKYDVLIVHFLRKKDIQFLTEKLIDIPKIWFFWGGDYFNQEKFYKQFLFKKTKKLKYHFFLKELSFFNGIKKFIKSFFPFIADLTEGSRKMLRAINSFDYIVPVMPGDYKLMQDNCVITPKMHHLNYVNPMVIKESIPKVKGRNILLGNSSTFTNNHLEAIDQLAEYDLEDREIIIPLNYGNEDLADYISMYAKQKLSNEKIMILRDFLPFDKYNELISSCEIVVMNHLRQQAVGNIVQALLYGSHVYLQSKSTVYKYLKSKGIQVNAFDRATQLESLSDEIIQMNRIKTKEVFNANYQRKKLDNLIEKALNT